MEALPSYQQVKVLLSSSDEQKAFIARSRQTIRQILNREDPRLLLIVGPCSLHDLASARHYGQLLSKLSKEVASQFFIVMRAHCEKPRTISGWKGLLYDPMLDGSYQIVKGIEYTRQILIELAEMQVPSSAEFLDPVTAFYYDDLISWGSIGARTSSSQPHRQLASGLEMPIGIKNGLAGNVSSAINGVAAVSQPHVYIGLNERGIPSVKRTIGNTDSHIVLRGGEHTGPNFDRASVEDAIRRLQHAGIPPRVLIDCSHHNSGKRYEQQPFVFQSVLEQVLKGSDSIRGMMVESHLQAGSQRLFGGSTHLKYGVSITDDCLSWESTEQLILQSADLIAQQRQRHISEEITHLPCAIAN